MTIRANSKYPVFNRELLSDITLQTFSNIENIFLCSRDISLPQLFFTTLGSKQYTCALYPFIDEPVFFLSVRLKHELFSLWHFILEVKHTCNEKYSVCVCEHTCACGCVYMCMCVHINVQVEARGHSSEAVHFGSGDRVSLLLPCKSKVSSWLWHPLTPCTLHPAPHAACCAVFS